MDESIGSRIADLIKALGIKRVRFAEQIQVDQSYVTQLTKGRNPPSDRLISAICREFNVDETWLRTGKGEMFIQKDPEPLETLLAGLLGGEKVTSEDRLLIKNFLELSDDSRKAVIEFVQKCAKELSAPPLAPAPENVLAAKVDALERQNRELLARLEAIEKEGDDDSTEATEAAYRRSSGYVPSADESALNITGGTASPSDKDKEKTTTESGDGESGNEVG